MQKINDELTKKTKEEEEVNNKEKEEKEAQEKEEANASLLEDTINSNVMSMSETSSSKVITKDRAYIASGKIIE